ncbi:MAG: M18 family aminopeptidase, partial [Clostridia bacterium]|nr:M18 family aminopeptidase [Clostridia bacterium]
MGNRDIALTQELINFIASSPVSYLVIQNAIQKLESEGYRRFNLQNGTLKSGGKYYLTRNGSSLLAFRLPVARPNGFMVTASHSDSPLFKLKTHYTVKACDRYCKLDTESYGGGIFSSWFDR